MVTVKVGDQTFSVRTEDATLALQSYYGDLQIGVVAYAFGYNPSAEGSVQYAKTRLATPRQHQHVRGYHSLGCGGRRNQIYRHHRDEQFEVTENSFRPDEEDLAAVDSEFTVTVQAIAADAANNSFAGTATLSRKLTNLAYSNGVLSWSPVLGVSQYGVRVNGGEETLVEGASAPVTLTQAGENVPLRLLLYGQRSERLDRHHRQRIRHGHAEPPTPAHPLRNLTDILSQATRSGFPRRKAASATLSTAGSPPPTADRKWRAGTVSATANVTYYAQWTANTYTVTLARDRERRLL